MIACILATDMTKHFPMIENMKTRFEEASDNPIGELDEDRVKCAELLVHCADLGNSTKTFDILYKWSK
jgi:hypothetical protein